jgi:hypothetical protein
MLPFDPQVLKYLPADRLAEHLKQLHPGMAVTHWRAPTRCELITVEAYLARGVES